MKHFQSFHPATAALYLLLTASVPMLCLNPIFLLIGALGSLLQLLLFCPPSKRGLRGVLILTAVFALIHPLFSRSGQTVLLMINDQPLTLEALRYSLASASAMGIVLIWFRIFSVSMTADRLLCLLSILSSRAALTLSIAMRSVTLIERQYRIIWQAQRAMGNVREDSLFHSLRSRLQAVSILITWALENGAVTADSMDARGYGSARRTAYRPYRLTSLDAAAIILILLLAVLPLALILNGSIGVEYYPTVSHISTALLAILAYACYFLLTLLPVFAYRKEMRLWNACASKT